MSALVDSLRAVPLFRDLSKKDLQRLAESMHERRFTAGDEVVLETDHPKASKVIVPLSVWVHNAN